MRAKNSLSLAFAAALAAAAAAAGPATRPALPAGHPPVGAASESKLPAGHPPVAGAEEQPKLPAGHPDVGGGSSAPSGLPPGHPVIPNPSTQPSGLPSGHPDLGAVTRKGQPGGFGTITIIARQRTRDAKAPAGARVTLELYNQGKVIGTVQTKLDDNGTVVVQNLPLGTPFQPLIRVNYAGIEFAAMGNPMDSRRAGQQVEMSVFEPTETAPDWEIAMRHVIIEPSATGARVTEILSIQTPGDRSWAGEKHGAARFTLALPLPAGAAEVQLGEGFGACCSMTSSQGIVNRLPLHPGATQLQYSYVIAPTEHKSTVTFDAPRPVKNMMAFVMETGQPVTAAGLTASGVHEMGNKVKAQIFGGSDLKPGQPASITVTLPPSEQQPAHGPLGSSRNTDTPKLVAAVGGGIMLALGAGYVLLKPTSTANPSR